MRLSSTILSLFAILAANAAFAANRLTVSVPDMECEECSQTLIKNFEKSPAVADAGADLGARVVTLTLKDGKHLDNARIQKIVRDSGFTPGTIAAKEEDERDESWGR